MPPSRVAPTALRIASGVELPLDYVTKTCAILAQRRKGKTYTAAVVAEELCAAGLPWVALDPTGAWWGLRASADGEKAGLPVVVIGGQHGDLPLFRDSGAVVADLVLDHPGWYVLDLSLLDSRAAERDLSLAFAQRLYRRKMEPGMDFPLHLFVDEADLFVPQERETKQDNLVLGAFSAIIRRGGLHGLGSTLISQRPALINKGVLTQLDLLVLLRLVAGQDQEAVYKDYVKRHGTKEQQAALMESLASLPVGEGWLWEPGAEPPLFERVRIRERRTFNSSATPKPGERRVEPRVFAKIDIDSLSEQMHDAVERQRESDPVELRRRIRELEAAALKEVRAEPVEVRVEVPVEVPIVPAWLRPMLEDYAERFESAERNAADGLEAAAEWLARLERESQNIAQEVAQSLRVSSEETGTRTRRGRDRHAGLHQSHPVQEKPGTGSTLSRNGELGTAARGFLATFARFYPMRLTVGQLGMLTGKKTRGGSFNTAMRQLRDAGFVREDGEVVVLTDAGLDEAGVIPEPMTLDRWREVLPMAARELLDVVVEADVISIDDAGARLGRATRGGSWNTAVKMLTLTGVVAKVGDEFRYVGV